MGVELPNRDASGEHTGTAVTGLRQMSSRWTGPLLLAAISQGTSSSTNFLLYIVLLLTADEFVFGRLVALLAVYQLVLATSRSVISEPMVAAAAEFVSNGQTDTTSVAGLWSSARRRLITFGVGGALLSAFVGLVLGASASTTALIVVSMVALVYQDGQRHLAWALGRPRLAVLIDLVWFAAAGTAVLTAWRSDHLTPRVMLSSWIGGGVVSAVFAVAAVERLVAASYGGRFAGGGSRPTSNCSEPASLRDVGRSQALHGAAFNILPIATAVLISPPAAGLMKASLLPFTPMLTVSAGLRLVTLPAMYRASLGGSKSLPPPAKAHGNRAVDGLTVRMMNLILPLSILLVVASVVAARFGTSMAGLTDQDLLGSVWWGGSIAVMSIAARHLADGLGTGRRKTKVVRLRMVSLAVEWLVLFAVAWFVSDEHVMAGWAVGVAIGTIVWLMPTLRRH